MKSSNITAKQKKRFHKLVKQLSQLIKEIRKNEPRAQYYVGSDKINLMIGPPHEGTGTAHRERVITSETFRYLDVGDW